MPKQETVSFAVHIHALNLNTPSVRGHHGTHFSLGKYANRQGSGFFGVENDLKVRKSCGMLQDTVPCP